MLRRAIGLVLAVTLAIPAVVIASGLPPFRAQRAHAEGFNFLCQAAWRRWWRRQRVLLLATGLATKIVTDQAFWILGDHRAGGGTGDRTGRDHGSGHARDDVHHADRAEARKQPAARLHPRQLSRWCRRRDPVGVRVPQQGRTASRRPEHEGDVHRELRPTALGQRHQRGRCRHRHPDERRDRQHAGFDGKFGASTRTSSPTVRRTSPRAGSTSTASGRARHPRRSDVEPGTGASRLVRRRRLSRSASGRSTPSTRHGEPAGRRVRHRARPCDRGRQAGQLTSDPFLSMDLDWGAAPRGVAVGVGRSVPTRRRSRGTTAGCRPGRRVGRRRRGVRHRGRPADPSAGARRQARQHHGRPRHDHGVPAQMDVILLRDALSFTRSNDVAPDVDLSRSGDGRRRPAHPEDLPLFATADATTFRGTS